MAIHSSILAKRIPQEGFWQVTICVVAESDTTEHLSTKLQETDNAGSKGK